MVAPIYSTKLYIPSVRKEIIHRQRLIEKLNHGLSCGLILLSAPAGYGKTTLLSAWIGQCGLPAAWISLDEGDNDLAHFLAYLTAALERVCPEAGQNLLTLLQSSRMPPLQDLLLPLVNGIDRAPNPFVLVLDDYHLIHEQSIQDVLMFILDHRPEKLHLILASRADPPLRLARLRARSELVEIRMDDLRFTLNETDILLNQAMKLDLTAENITALNSRTEGWIAGLRMAALSIRDQEDKTAFIGSFSGSNRYILDYLVEEILQHQPERIQTFLLATSILPLLTGPLCVTVSGMEDSQEIIEALERDNLFVFPIDAERRWYRCHQLFRDLLYKRLKKKGREYTLDLHCKASRWFEENGFQAEAIEHALDSEDLERSADLIEAASQVVLMHSEIATFSSWINRLPTGMVHARPNLELCSIWVLLIRKFTPEEVEAKLSLIDGDTGYIQAKADVIRGYIGVLRGDMDRSVELVRSANSRLPESEAFFRHIAGWLLSYAHVAMGNFSLGHRSLEEIVEDSLEKENFTVAASALCQLAQVHIRQAQLRDARQDYERVLAISKDAHGWMPFAAQALIGMAELFLEYNELDSATHYVEEGLELAGQTHIGAVITGFITLARIQAAKNNFSAADRAIQQALEFTHKTKATNLDDLVVLAIRAQIQIAKGSLDEAYQWVLERGLAKPFDPAELDNAGDFANFHVRKYEFMVLARYWIAVGDVSEALHVLDEVCVRMEAQGRKRLALESYLLSSLAYQKTSDRSNALLAVEKAVQIAAPEGYIRLFLNEGPLMGSLLADFRDQIIGQPQKQALCTYADRLLSFFAPQQVSPAGSQAALPTKLSRSKSTLEEPLSERELQLLGLIAKGLTNQEIAQRLFISLPTVKWHTNNIFGKLSVQNRIQAVVKARELGILPEP